MINFAIIGTGWITESFVESAHASGSWKLVAVYSRKAETAAQFGEKFGVHYVFTSVEDLAQDEGIQAVYIASPNSLHFEQAKFLLSHKRHVIVEKPATSRSKELNELFNLAHENGVFLIEANRHIQEVNFKILQKNLSRLGPIYGASLNYASYSSRYNAVLDGQTPNIFSLAFSGGSLVDLGVYPIAAAVALFGKPVSQTYKPVIIPSGGDAGGIVVLFYEKFAVSCLASKCFTSKAPSEVFGEKGTLAINAVTDIEHVTFLDARTKKSEELGEKKAELNLMEEAAEFARIIENGDKEAAGKLEEMSKIVISITEDLRHQNGLIFDVEKAA
ncbi:NAD(P)-binding protein [Rhizodiscina lignyota]|uniref:NAD(P)-binding protein n=1 Tax=Rhizodiscina lignyota TaxID=1504668 RepID=A0A9P4IJ05_9PEZI|nr:NAD(P)-binding protein [Rhizodiscina lignyota]